MKPEIFFIFLIACSENPDKFDLAKFEQSHETSIEYRNMGETSRPGTELEPMDTDTGEASGFGTELEDLDTDTGEMSRPGTEIESMDTDTGEASGSGTELEPMDTDTGEASGSGTELEPMDTYTGEASGSSTDSLYKCDDRICPPMVITIPWTGTYYLDCLDCNSVTTGSIYSVNANGCHYRAWEPNDPIPQEMIQQQCDIVLCCS